MKHLLSRVLLAWLLPGFAVQAELITDGSLGAHGVQTLSGPQYEIGENLGQRLGGNLFHSFSQFNIGAGETATFHTGSGVNNILARVAGGEMSSIDGRIAISGSAANLWLINPQGWLIGKNALFDIKGDLHVTTANAIGFADNGKFYADPAKSSQLTIAAPLTLELDQPSNAVITIDQADLHLPVYHTVSLTAPHLELNQSAIEAPGGHILLGGLSAGVWNLGAQSLHGQTPATGSILIRENNSAKAITTSQYGLSINGVTDQTNIDGGSVELTAGSINMIGGAIIQSAVSGRQGGDIVLNANDIELRYGMLSSDAVYDGNAGNIRIQAENLRLSHSSITTNSQTHSSGNAGHLDIVVDNELVMGAESKIASENIGSGSGGKINISAAYIELTHSADIRVAAYGSGDAGQITFSARDLNLSSGGTINSSTLAQGKGGTIAIQTEQLQMSDPETFITSSTSGAGQGGAVAIRANQLTVANDAQIRTKSKGVGDAGSIQLKVNDQFWLDHAKVTTKAKQSNGGPIDIQANTLFLRHGQLTTSVEGLLGNGGNIDIAATNLIMDGGFIQANTAASGAHGGDIHIAADRMFAGGDQVLVGGQERLHYQPLSRLNIIQAAAPLGVSGNISLNTVELNLSGQLLPLNTSFISSQNILDNPCHAKRGQRLSSLFYIGSIRRTAADPVITSLQHYLTPTIETDLLPITGSQNAVFSCP